jgi:hypothetical protein
VTARDDCGADVGLFDRLLRPWLGCAGVDPAAFEPFAVEPFAFEPVALEPCERELEPGAPFEVDCPFPSFDVSLPGTEGPPGAVDAGVRFAWGSDPGDDAVVGVVL